jgi:hypothetical protein
MTGGLDDGLDGAALDLGGAQRLAAHRRPQPTGEQNEKQSKGGQRAGGDDVAAQPKLADEAGIEFAVHGDREPDQASCQSASYCVAET